MRAQQGRPARQGHRRSKGEGGACAQRTFAELLELDQTPERTAALTATSNRSSRACSSTDMIVLAGSRAARCWAAIRHPCSSGQPFLTWDDTSVRVQQRAALRSQAPIRPLQSYYTQRNFLFPSSSRAAWKLRNDSASGWLGGERAPVLSKVCPAPASSPPPLLSAAGAACAGRRAGPPCYTDPPGPAPGCTGGHLPAAPAPRQVRPPCACTLHRPSCSARLLLPPPALLFSRQQ